MLKLTHSEPREYLSIHVLSYSIVRVHYLLCSANPPPPPVFFHSNQFLLLYLRISLYIRTTNEDPSHINGNPSPSPLSLRVWYSTSTPSLLLLVKSTVSSENPTHGSNILATNRESFPRSRGLPPIYNILFSLPHCILADGQRALGLVANREQQRA